MPESVLSDTALVRQVQLDGNDEAFAAIVRRYQSPLRQFARKLLKSEEQGDEVVQEVFLIAYRRLGSFRGGSLRSWLLTITYRESLRTLQQKRKPLLLDEDYQVVYDQITRLDVGKALDALDERERQILVAWLYWDRSHGEIAAQEGVPLGTVKGILSRAKKKVRQFLGGSVYEG
ncbi:RNA polymerase sigma factor [Pseudobacteriovorax antillogorgiicola]|uniref:RNA polymerase sigma-70 factor, ECF subfamily n=1 Tax=Pseudobacteriovorax antillogorgiicola TaxID=1513793 RepID=A0A1Y6CY93_9BACT|nr:sigma-70 family RNA polymerase sigma factor [Pseudobacteriovorax antillogorgiicola]TCS42223.1 RNA polymerase sigma-70 factor (ECF subfamily) [Pseudobacteriovorax antillogorgiicola]SMF82761.1 RNA polymerase sigma-70 factor, ECF subfamily [Pseudobacteriovorax antillogorgiicola]